MVTPDLILDTQLDKSLDSPETARLYALSLDELLEELGIADDGMNQPREVTMDTLEIL